jgi:hypothetical protein
MSKSVTSLVWFFLGRGGEKEVGVGKSTLGGYQLLNIPAGTVLNFLKIIHTNLVLTSAILPGNLSLD